MGFMWGVKGFFCSLMILLLVSVSVGQGEGSKALPFSPGEELVYQIRWQQIQAGTCSMRVLPSTPMGNTQAFHFQLEIQTNEFVDKLYKVRDVMEGFVAEDFSGSLLYKKTTTGKSKKQVVVEFFPKTQEVVYSNFGKKRAPIKIPPNTFDPVSSFFHMRTLDFETGKILAFPVTDGKKSFVQQGEILKKEQITLASGVFDTFLLAPSVTHFSGVFEKSTNPEVRVWISDDEKKIPVRIQVKVLVGSIIFDLVSAKPGGSDTE